MTAFTAYSRPGNVRELQNLVELAVIRSEEGVLRSLATAILRIFTSVAILVLLVALTAAYFPARRAANVNLVVSLRYE